MEAIMALVASALAVGVLRELMGNSIPEVLKKRKYCRNLKKNVDTLRKKVIGLNQLKTDVELRKRNIGRGRMVKNEVEHWLSCVKIINEELQVVEKLCSAISRSCLAQSWLGKTVLGKIGEVEKLCEEGKFPGDIGIDRPSTPAAKLLFFTVKFFFKKLKVGAVTNALMVMDILMAAVSRKLEYFRNLKKNMNTLREGVTELNQLKDVIDRPSTSGAKLQLFPVKGSFKKLKHALDRLNRQKEEVETLKSGHENAGEVVSEKVNDWLIAVRSINAVIQILEDVYPWVSPCDIHKFNEIVLEKSQEVSTLQSTRNLP